MACGVASGASSDDPLDAIVGGYTASPHSIPWQVGLIDTSWRTCQLGCGGTLVSSRHVITAAHCTVGKLPYSYSYTVIARPIRSPIIEFSLSY